MPTLSPLNNDLKSLDLSYKQIMVLREVLIEELKQEIGTKYITIDLMRLIEQRVQTLIMAGLMDEKTIKRDIREPKIHL